MVKPFYKLETPIGQSFLQMGHMAVAKVVFSESNLNIVKHLVSTTFT